MEMLSATDRSGTSDSSWNTQTTPAAFVRASRVEAARRLLEGSDAGMADIARRCGFGTVETMHRAFRRTVNTTPGAYRRHFSPTELSA